MKQAAKAPKQWLCLSTQLWPNPCGGVSTYYKAAVQPLVHTVAQSAPGLAPIKAAKVQLQKPAVASILLDAQLANLKPTSTQQQQRQQRPHPVPRQLAGFNDAQLAFSAKSTRQLMQSLAIFKACSVKPLVQNADNVIALATRVLGSTVVNAIVRQSLFAQFCGGECEDSTQHKAAAMRQNGIQPILHFVAESDVSSPALGPESAEAIAERTSDQHLKSFHQSIELGKRSGGKPFTQAKVTALGNCDMLKEASSHLLKGGRERGHLVQDLPAFMACALSAPQLHLFNSMLRRVDSMCAAAQQANVRILVDAEYSYAQPAIDAVILHMQAKHNKAGAYIFNTYQCYLKDSHARIMADMQHAREAGFVWAGKLVRGAYIHMERQRAQQLGYPCPVHDTLQDTHNNYNRCVEQVMRQVQQDRCEMMVASHNQASLEQAVALMQGLGLPPACPRVHFGQLQGMADHLTYTLGANGYQAYKAVPYGPVEETMAYLVRRAKENSDVLGGVGKETAMLKAELWRRLTSNNAVARYVQKESAQPVYSAAA